MCFYYAYFFLSYPKKPDTDVLVIKLLHRQQCNDPIIGELEIPVGYYMNRGPTDVWKQWNIRDRNGAMKEGKGHVHFQVLYKRTDKFVDY